LISDPGADDSQFYRPLFIQDHTQSGGQQNTSSEHLESMSTDNITGPDTLLLEDLGICIPLCLPPLRTSFHKNIPLLTPHTSHFLHHDSLATAQETLGKTTGHPLTKTPGYIPAG